MINETINLLGRRATDRVTGFNGVVISVCFDLFGCVQAALSPPAKDGEEAKNSSWFDVNRLTVGNEVVMPVPDFDGKAVAPADYQHGPAAKAAYKC